MTASAPTPSEPTHSPASPEPNKPNSSNWLTPGVVAIGLTSCLSDISHEMVTPLLPFLIHAIGITQGASMILGLVEGVADFVSSIAKLSAGYIGAHLRYKKPVAVAGYTVTALANALFAVAVVWPHVLLGRVVGWLGRGFRGPLRDTLMAEQTDQRHFGKAYGLERALDSVGAVLGPLFVLLLLSRGLELHEIFWLTLIPGLAAAACFLFGVRETPAPPVGGEAGFQPGAESPQGETPDSAPRRPRERGVTSFWELPAPFRRFLVAVALFGLGDFSRTLLLLWATGEELDLTSGVASQTLLLYLGYNLVSAASSFASGRRSDQGGRKPMLLLGYSMGALVSLVMALAGEGTAVLAAVFVGSGIYMGIQEAVERAAAADLLPQQARSFGFGILATINGVGDLVASFAVGVLWATAGATVAFLYSALLCLAGCIALWWVAFPSRPNV